MSSIVSYSEVEWYVCMPAPSCDPLDNILNAHRRSRHNLKWLKLWHPNWRNIYVPEKSARSIQFRAEFCDLAPSQPDDVEAQMHQVYSATIGLLSESHGTVPHHLAKVTQTTISKPPKVVSERTRFILPDRLRLVPRIDFTPPTLRTAVTHYCLSCISISPERYTSPDSFLLRSALLYHISFFPSHLTSLPSTFAQIVDLILQISLRQNHVLHSQGNKY